MKFYPKSWSIIEKRREADDLETISAPEIKLLNAGISIQMNR